MCRKQGQAINLVHLIAPHSWADTPLYLFHSDSSTTQLIYRHTLSSSINIIDFIMCLAFHFIGMVHWIDHHFKLAGMSKEGCCSHGPIP